MGVKPVTGLTVKPLCSAPAQVCAGKEVIVPLGLLMQGTSGFPGSLANALTIACCAALGSPAAKAVGAAAVGPAKIKLFVRRGTAFCEFCSRPSNAPNKKVLSF